MLSKLVIYGSLTALNCGGVLFFMLFAMTSDCIQGSCLSDRDFVLMFYGPLLGGTAIQLLFTIWLSKKRKI